MGSKAGGERTIEEDKSPSTAGHRQRLKERFLHAGGDALPDYELLELFLFLLIPQKDVKPLAKELLTQFGSFAAVVTASPKLLMEVKGVKEGTVCGLKILQASCERLARSVVLEQPVLSSWEQLEQYCQVKLSHLDHEEFHILFLDTKNRLIRDELHQRGTLNQAAAYPREIVKRCLEVGAASVILVHNHPSGDPTPSKADIEMTRRILEATRVIGVMLHDHLVVSRQGNVSFKALGLL